MNRKRDGFPLFLTVFFLVWALRGTVFYGIDLSFPEGGARGAYSNAVKFAVWVVPAFLYLWILERRNPLTYLKLTTSPDARGLLLAVVLTIVYFAVTLVHSFLTTHRTLAPLFRLSPSEWAGVLASVAVSPIWEEIMFRGFVLGQLCERMGFWRANFLTAVLFTMVHWPYWLWANGSQSSMLVTSAAIALLAVFLGYLVQRTRSLWPSVVVHILNNFLSHFLTA